MALALASGSGTLTAFRGTCLGTNLSAGSARGYMGRPYSGNTVPNDETKRVRCSRGRSPRILRNSFRRHPVTPSRLLPCDVSSEAYREGGRLGEAASFMPLSAAWTEGASTPVHSLGAAGLWGGSHASAPRVFTFRR